MAKSTLNQATRIEIPFQPLLLQITQHLHFPAPKYEFADMQKNSAVVLLFTYSGPEAFTFVGGPATTLESSCEKAAYMAVKYLMDRFNVWVEDISISKRREYERCAGLYKLKHQEIHYLTKGVVGFSLIEKSGMGTPLGSEPVIVDYAAILLVIVHKCGIQSSGLEVISHGRSKYTTCITITYPKSSGKSKTFFSVRCEHAADARNTLAKQVIDYLVPLFNLEIVDANYNPSLTAYATVKCALEMESYITARERFSGFELAPAPSRLLPLRKCHESKVPKQKIPTMISLPVPPKKRPSTTSSMRMSIKNRMKHGHIHGFKVPEELSTVAKRAKYRYTA